MDDGLVYWGLTPQQPPGYRLEVEDGRDTVTKSCLIRTSSVLSLFSRKLIVGFRLQRNGNRLGQSDLSVLSPGGWGVGVEGLGVGGWGLGEGF